MGGGGGSAKIGDGCGALVVLKEESMGEAAGGKMGTRRDEKNHNLG